MQVPAKPDSRQRCAACGYNLYGNTTGTCPECGLVIAGSHEKAAKRRRSKVACAFLLSVGIISLTFAALPWLGDDWGMSVRFGDSVIRLPTLHWVEYTIRGDAHLLDRMYRFAEQLPWLIVDTFPETSAFIRSGRWVSPFSVFYLWFMLGLPTTVSGLFILRRLRRTRHALLR